MHGVRSGASASAILMAVLAAGALLALPPADPRGWKRLTLSKGSWGGPAYSIAIPPGIRGGERQGIDSAVASLRGRGLYMNFDYGPYGGYSGCGRAAACIERAETIDGRAALIATRESAANRKISARITLAEGPTVDLFADCTTPAACELVVRMIRSIRFFRQSG